METGELIRMYRTRRGMTQQELAEKVGYKHKTAISKIEMGEVDLPQSKIQQFADIFGIRPSVLIEGEITNNQKKKGART
jgi:repressor LexA